MNGYPTIQLRIIAFVVLFSILIPSNIYSSNNTQSDVITKWQINWAESDDWVEVDSQKSIPTRPQGVTSAWIKVTLPQVHSNNLGLYISEIFGQNIDIFLDEQLVFRSERDILFNDNRILLTIDPEDSGKLLYIWVESLNELNDLIGINKEIQIAKYSELLAVYGNTDVGSVIVGNAFVLIALIILACSIFLGKEQIVLCVSLGIVILSMGILFVTYPPYIFIFYKEYGAVFEIMYDIALFISIPALLYFFEQIFGSGYRSIITTLRKFQFMYSLFCIIFMIINNLTSYQFNTQYYFATATIFGIFMLVHLIVLCITCIHYAVKKNIDAIIFSGGFLAFASLGVANLVSYYTYGSQYLFLWRGGAICFVISLILILGRNLASLHKQVTAYSNKLEMFSYQIQRSEKLEIVSELAASIAHEVRNPLQVTRGFLQLFAEKTEDKERLHMNLAIQELDRASNIITDFLTFAKPQLEDVTMLDVEDELRQIEGIIVPLVNLRGGKIEFELSKNLYIQGSSAKFKQAMINIIKNSVEAFNDGGKIHISSFKTQDKACIRIQDNGDGMEPECLVRLGEPFFSTKTKGTGLGLMVTFRIIELMQGSIKFTSIKGEGTEVVIHFSASANTETRSISKS